jgi:glucokinase
LLADVGGTNVRFTLEREPLRLDPVVTLKVADFPSLEAAARHYLSGIGEAPRHAAIGLANPVTQDMVKLTNHSWAFSVEGMRCAMGLDTLLAINDFTALALALPYLPAQGLARIRPGQAQASAPSVLIGPGTGLGVSGLIPGYAGAPAVAVAVAGEGGHMEVMPETEDEWTAWRAAQREFGHVSAERLLSGAGLSLIHGALAAQAGAAPAAPLAPEAVTAGALEQGDPLCRRSMRVFFGLLGSVAADVALVLGARAGVYIGGGIVPRFVGALQDSPFCERFLAKGRMRAYLDALPIFVVTAAHPALLGLSVALSRAVPEQG